MKTTIRHVWSVLCKIAITDKRTNNISLINVIENISYEFDKDHPIDLPLPLDCELVSLWARKDPKNPVKVRVRDRLLAPDESILAEAFFDLDLTSSQRARTGRRFSSIVASVTGQYEFQTCVDSGDGRWVEVSRIPLTISVGTVK